MKQSHLALALIVGAIVALVVWRQFGATGSGDAGPIVAVSVPSTLSREGEAGKILFDQNCAECHGPNAAGSANGPPLVHELYEPNHHADFAFVLAAKTGARAHHWNFGNMPPVPDIAEEDVLKIVAYVRELQRANGIE